MESLCGWEIGQCVSVIAESETMVGKWPMANGNPAAVDQQKTNLGNLLVAYKQQQDG
jgi:hypothetical protein